MSRTPHLSGMFFRTRHISANIVNIGLQKRLITDEIGLIQWSWMALFLNYVSYFLWLSGTGSRQTLQAASSKSLYIGWQWR